MKKMITLCFVCGAILLGRSAHASFLVEPILGYNLGSFENGLGEDKSFTGVGIGGRLGVEFLGVQAALDGNFSTIDIDDMDEADLREFGFFAGYDFPILLRAWMGFIFSSSLELGTADFSGSGTKFGLGISPLPLLSLNLEYKMMNFDEFEINGVTSEVDRDMDVIFLSVSVPLNL